MRLSDLRRSPERLATGRVDRWPAGLLAVVHLAALVKFRYHITFLGAVCGALLFADRLDAELAGRLVLLYIVFNVLLYGGLYTINDIADRATDARHPRKRFRPVASGAIPLPTACVIAVVFVTAGLAGGAALFNQGVAACFLAAVVFNLVYSLFGRNRRYLDVALNSVTHPNRFLMGALLVGRVPPVAHLVTLLMLAISFSCLRREIERDGPGWQSRSSLAAYRQCELRVMTAMCLVCVGACAARFGSEAPGFYLIVSTTAAVIGVGGSFESTVRRSLREIWTR